MERTFTLAEARDAVPALKSHVERLVVLRADLADAQAALAAGGDPPGGLPELKATEARLQEALDWFAAMGIQLKGIAPVIVDFPAVLDGRRVLLCWLEGEESLEWFHPEAVGFMGRRRLP
jgi:hypothetical protein